MSFTGPSSQTIAAIAAQRGDDAEDHQHPLVLVLRPAPARAPLRLGSIDHVHDQSRKAQAPTFQATSERVASRDLEAQGEIGDDHDGRADQQARPMREGRDEAAPGGGLVGLARSLAGFAADGAGFGMRRLAVGQKARF